MDYQYTLQLHSGTFQKSNYSWEEIKTKCDQILTHIQVKQMIIGWNTDTELNQKILDYFHEKDIRVLLWFPLLLQENDERELKKMEGYHGNSFDFCCPTHLHNAHACTALYEKYFAKLPFDGIFLDKIRYASFSQGYEAGFGCFCEECMKQMHYVDIDAVKALIDTHDTRLLRGEYDRCGRYHFADSQVNAFYKRRSQLISDLVFKLAAYFNSRKLIVGIDLFAPILAYHVGQNIKEIAKYVDFIKPMMYTHTNAPAAIPYEYNAYLRNFESSEAFSKHFPGGPLSSESLRYQMDFIKNVPATVIPGIEINPISGVCDTNAEAVQKHLHIFREFKNIALCWDVMRMDDEILAVL